MSELVLKICATILDLKTNVCSAENIALSCSHMSPCTNPAFLSLILAYDIVSSFDVELKFCLIFFVVFSQIYALESRNISYKLIEV